MWWNFTFLVTSCSDDDVLQVWRPDLRNKCELSLCRTELVVWIKIPVSVATIWSWSDWFCSHIQSWKCLQVFSTVIFHMWSTLFSGPDGCWPATGTRFMIRLDLLESVGHLTEHHFLHFRCVWKHRKSSESRSDPLTGRFSRGSELLRL